MDHREPLLLFLVVASQIVLKSSRETGTVRSMPVISATKADAAADLEPRGDCGHGVLRAVCAECYTRE
jgi:hypothetical protein